MTIIKQEDGITYLIMFGLKMVHWG